MLLCLTANHQNASFDLLEKLSFAAPGAATTLVADSAIVEGAVVLATCNRFEAYLEIDDVLHASENAAANTINTMSAASGVDADALRNVLTVLRGDEVVEHLFAVSSGLESVVVGEDEISGQVRRSLERAREVGTTSSGLERLFQKATQTSRGVKTQTALGGAGRSLVRLGLELATSRVTDWAQTRVLLVGTGQYAATTVVALRDRGVVDISVFSPSGRAQAFALKHELRAQYDLSEAIGASDIVITCTAYAAVDATVIPNDNRRLIIDLGLPRNVDPAVASLPGVELLDLETISLHAPVEALTAADDARALVGLAAADFAADRSVEPAIVALRSHVFDLLDAEIARARSRGAGDETEAALRHLAGVLLHEPSVRARLLAKEGRANEFVDGLDAVYGVRSALVQDVSAADIEDDRDTLASA
ncbi:glutamyl-tRNA reductase [Glaciihabitans sp. dw_435]|uniref:glutamyl-tRNA reductase n=1 Tax=Glaciihabitans sp. dw_435 TaxID=2720081 RepID=UPI001BD6A570|nr:glutamyl-tRNA reductase [Glaciihabitans sp. dw_435]